MSMLAVLLSSVARGVVVVPLLWLIGAVCVILGAVSILRGAIVRGVLLVAVGVLLGGLNVF